MANMYSGLPGKDRGKKKSQKKKKDLIVLQFTPEVIFMK